MRLALITQDFTPKIGGIQTYALELAKRFNKKCDFFCVIAPDVPGAAEVDEKLPFPVKRIKTPEPWLGWAGIPEIPLYIYHHSIDRIFHTQWNTLPVSLMMKKTGLINHIYVAAHARELLFNPVKGSVFGGGYAKYRQKMLSKADYFFPVSEFTAGLLQNEGILSEQIQVVTNGTDPEEFYPLKSDDLKKELGIENRKILLTITRLVSRKGIDTVLKAMPIIVEDHPELLYMIVGEGEQRPQLEQLVDELNLHDHVHFTGKIPHTKLNGYYNSCDVFVMPSKTELPDVEGFGLVFLEANACGKPVIGSYSGGIPSAIIHEETGLMVEQENPKELAAAVNHLLNNPDLAEKLGQQGRQRVVEEANWNRAAERIIKLMR
ncbi:glycosyltransferase family 4 protein [Gracilimonas mengyeensis]|uniref:Phosphatidylinositol alpha-1,6-mannosyltransferase n=1 Tax=Gracilimonas mengyeensis TaxID=1302730 RepID=A0A521ABQ5_9BACT|nr:glycosyltransferase family 4 protein [Gracilimonas mengyeensis]SMO32244.1 phosphatidylinositol alpha-1,6-mannosyltransferase [Gracilimonas mengyeensis]